jgi:hypothetical protein
MVNNSNNHLSSQNIEQKKKTMISRMLEIQVTCSHYDIAVKISLLALKNNCSLIDLLCEIIKGEA